MPGHINELEPSRDIALVVESKCQVLFRRGVPDGFYGTYLSYVIRQDDFVLFADQLQFVSKSDGTITPGPSIELPPGGYSLRTAHGAARGMIFLAEKWAPDASSFMISEPQIVGPNRQMTAMVWKAIPLKRGFVRRPIVKVFDKYILFLEPSKDPSGQYDYQILDHSRDEMVPVTLDPHLPHLQGLATVDGRYFVSNGRVFDLANNGKCKFNINTRTPPTQAVSSSYVCFVMLHNEALHGRNFTVQLWLLIWSKVAKCMVGKFRLSRGTIPQNVAILEDRLAVILGTCGPMYVLNVVDIKTMRARIIEQEHPTFLFIRIWNRLKALDSGDSISRHNIWDELHHDLL